MEGCKGCKECKECKGYERQQDSSQAPRSRPVRRRTRWSALRSDPGQHRARLRQAGINRRWRPALAPGLKLQDIPERILPVARAREVFLPLLADRRGVEEPLGPQPPLVEQVLGPLA